MATAKAKLDKLDGYVDRIQEREEDFRRSWTSCDDVPNAPIAKLVGRQTTGPHVVCNLPGGHEEQVGTSYQNRADAMLVLDIVLRINDAILYKDNPTQSRDALDAGSCSSYGAKRIDAQQTAYPGRLKLRPLEQPTCRCEKEGCNSCNCAGPANEPGSLQYPQSWQCSAVESIFSVHGAVVIQSYRPGDRNNKGKDKGKEKKDEKNVVKDNSSRKRRLFQKSGTTNSVGMIHDSAQAVPESQGFAVQDESDSGGDANHVGDSSDSAEDINLTRTGARARTAGST
ncbi:hypothetical protein LQW54_001939 [Pestalotiopsis sp. IQ-011]